MKRYIRIYKVFLSRYFKSLLEYRVDFLIGMLSFLFTQAAGIMVLFIVFDNVVELAGWTLYEVILLYAIFQVPRGIDHLFMDGIWVIPYHIQKGTFDRFLTKPLNILFQIIADRFQPDAIGELVTGTILIIYVIPKIDINFTFVTFLFLSVFIIMGTVIYASIKLLTNSLAFWIIDCTSISSIVYNVSDFAKQPLSIYGEAMKFFFSYILPFGFTSYYPAMYLFGKADGPQLLIQGTLITVVLAIISYSFWKYALRFYSSAGS